MNTEKFYISPTIVVVLGFATLMNTLNVDETGQLFKLDIWKIDFSKRSPAIALGFYFNIVCILLLARNNNIQ